jgi:hypothetical protein
MVQKHSQKIAYAAIAASMAVVCTMLAQYVPFLNIMPMIACALCYYIALHKAGWAVGVLGVAAGALLSLLIFGPVLAVIMHLLIFAPYSLLCYLLRRLSHSALRTAVLRLTIICVFFMLVALIFLHFFRYVLGAYSIVSQLPEWAIYAVYVPLAVIVGVVNDYLFCKVSKVVLKGALNKST